VARPRWKKTAIVAVKSALGILVLVMVGREVARTLGGLESQGAWPSIDPKWMALAVGLYLAGLGLFGAWYWRILESSATPIGFLPAVRAYVISHLGKYVPGKAMVVVLRVGFASPYGARPATAAFAAFYETLVMMATGGLLAAVGFLLSPQGTISLPAGPLGTLVVPLALVGLGPGLVFLGLAWPTVFPALTRVMTSPFPGMGPDALPRFSYRLLGEGVLWCLGGWICWGLSQVAVIRAMSPEGLPFSAWTPAASSVALATVAGFLVPVSPGGLGVREGILWEALKGTLQLDHARAVLGSLCLRLAWITGEVFGALALWLVRPARPVSAPPAESASTSAPQPHAPPQVATGTTPTARGDAPR
jgi:hypothetical protein